MDIEIKIIASDSREQLESLENWLRMESELRGSVRRPERPDETSLGSLYDILVVAMSAGGAFSVLASSLSTWLQQPRMSDITVRITKPDGQSFEIDAKRVKADEIQSIISNSLQEEE